MNKIIYHISFLAVCIMLVSCNKDFLDRTPGADLPEEKVFSDPVLAMNYADNAYNFLIDDYARMNSHRGATAQAADEAVSGNNDNSIRTLNQGLFHDHYEGRGGGSLNEIGDVWKRAYEGIRITNTMLSKMGDIPWSGQPIDLIKGEMHFLRAFLYFELIKRFGGVPIVDKPATIFDDVDIPRNTYQECLDFILKDLDQAEVLPEDHTAANYGRATKGAVKALRSRVLLYAASPLNNPADDRAKWVLAAAAAKEVMDMNNKYTLTGQSYSTIMNEAYSPEYIMIKVRPPRVIDGMMLDFVMSPGSGAIQGSMNPTQNHVDMYEMQATGLPITDPASGYNPQKPYEGRDPRFYANILYNDANWQGRKMGMWSQTLADGSMTYGADFRPNNIIYSATRYYCRKMWPEVYVRNTTQRALFNFIFFRYGEVLLNYAEAQNEAAQNNNERLLAVNAVNEIRRRVSMPDLPNNLTKEALRKAIRMERAVELAFEDHRWYDLIRWKEAVEVINQPVKGMTVVRNADGSFTYNVVTLQSIYQKKFEEHMYLYPIPRNEVWKSNGILKQNPNW